MSVELWKLRKEFLGEVPENMKPACISDNGSVNETENAGHFRLLKHPFTSPSKMPKGRLGTEVFQSEYLFHAGTEEMPANLSRNTGSKILPVCKGDRTSTNTVFRISGLSLSYIDIHYSRIKQHSALPKENAALNEHFRI